MPCRLSQTMPADGLTQTARGIWISIWSLAMILTLNRRSDWATKLPTRSPAFSRNRPSPLDELCVTKAMLACTILDGLQAILALLRSQGQAHADTVARSMFEALGDLLHLTAADDGGRA